MRLGAPVASPQMGASTRACLLQRAAEKVRKPGRPRNIRDLTLHGMCASGQNIVGVTVIPSTPHIYLALYTLHDTFDTPLKEGVSKVS